MRDALHTRILAVALAFATLGVCVLAGFNLSQELNSEFPTDGVVWLEAQGGLRAERVPADSPAGKAGIRKGDILEAINGVPTPRLASQVREMYSNGIWYPAANYLIFRPVAGRAEVGSEATFPVQVYLVPEDRSMAQGSRLIALVYLLIGLYVLFRRWTAPKSLHFYIFCLVSFVLYAFKSTGDPGVFDHVIYWGNLIANMVQPALFVHFAVSFWDAAGPIRSRGEGADAAWARAAGAAVCAGRVSGGLAGVGDRALVCDRGAEPPPGPDRRGYMAVYYTVAAVVFHSRYVRAESPLTRQQLKWLTRGTLLAVGPYTLLYAVPYLLGFTVPVLLEKIVLLALVLLPLTFSWAIVRYRLMDVDLIFKRGVTYTLATAALAGFYFLAGGHSV